MHEALALALFMACVGLATYAQNLTGFAFGLILLGLVSVLHIAEVADAANAATVLSLFNAWSYFRARPGGAPWRLVRPSIVAGAFGVAAGVGLLGWLGGTSVDYLRGLLGLAILACAALLVLQARPLERVSGAGTFAFVGALSGLLGGLFASSGPPMVFHMYRQPLERELVRRALLLVFALNALVRLAIVLATGQFSLRALLLVACALPVVHAATRWHHRLPSSLAPKTLQRVVAGLLVLAGGLLLVDALRNVLRA